MKTMITIGHLLVDADGDEIEIVDVGKKSVVLRNEDDELVIADIDEVMQDLASGDLIDLESDA